MGIDGLSFFGKDYAAEFREKWGSQIETNRQKLSSMGVSIPIGQSQSSGNTNKGLEVEKEKPEEEEKFERQFTSKKDIKKAQEAAERKFKENGVSKGENIENVKDEKHAEKLAENYVENQYNKEQVKGTQVFMDKKAYKAAEKARKEQRKKLIEEYREQGMSRKEAKEMADAQLVENEYVRGKKTRAYIEEHKEDFYDENGNFSSDKFKAKAVEYANTHTTEGEVENYHLSLKERRAVAEKEGVSANVIKNIAKKSNLDYERDNTNLYKGLVIAGATGAGVAAGPLFATTASAAAASAAASSSSSAVATGGTNASAADSAADAAASSSAAAQAKTNGYVTGAGVGFAVGVGLSQFVKDKGNKEEKVYEPGKPQAQPQPQPTPEPDKPPVQPQPDVPPVQTPQPPIQDCPVETWQSEFCDHTVRKGDDWTKVTLAKVKTINGKKPEGKILRAYVHAEKLKHGVTNFSLNTMPKVGEKMRVYSDFSDLLADEELVKKHPELLLLKDAQIELNCDGQTNGRSSNARARVKYTPFTGEASDAVKYKQDCHDPEPVIIK